MSVQDLLDYYSNLLILQYLGKPKAYATIQALTTPVVMPQTSVQVITFPAVAASGAFKLQYDEDETTSLAWNALAATIQTALRLLPGLSAVTVEGSIASQSLTITFTGVNAPALLLEFSANTLVTAGAAPIFPTVEAIDQTLPLAVQDAFNLLGSDIAVGAQLDILGKYAGVTRAGTGIGGQPISLDDTDFYSLINMAIIRNSSGSSLEEIQRLLHQFFGDAVLVFDYQNMQMSYMFSYAIGSIEVVAMFVTQGLLPRPMGVAISSIIYAPVITTFFGFRTYLLPAFNSTPFNSYADYQTDWPWLSYANAVIL